MSAIEDLLNSNSSDYTINTELSNNMRNDSSSDFYPFDLLGMDNITGNMTVNLNEVYVHGGLMMGGTYCVLATFIFYVPRMIYYRFSRRARDRELPGYFTLCYLSMIPCLAGVIHFCNFQAFITGTTELNSTTFGDKVIVFYLMKSSAASINRLVAPILAVLLLEQIATHTQYSLPMFQNAVVNKISCVILTIFVVAYTFVREYFFMSALTPESQVYPDHVHLDPYDLIAPIITVALFFFARRNIERRSVYSVEKVGPNDPSTLDRVSKVVIFQAVMTLATVVCLWMGPTEEKILHAKPDDSPVEIFFWTAQTPAIHWVLLRSLLRNKKPTTLCFLMCCCNGTKVGVAPEDEIEMGEHAGSANQNQTEEEGEEEEEEPETLDANKIVILPESQAEEVIRREALEMAEVVEIRAEALVDEDSVSDENVGIPSRNNSPNPNRVPRSARDNNPS